jgi:hypothetical protein
MVKAARCGERRRRRRIERPSAILRWLYFAAPFMPMIELVASLWSDNVSELSAQEFSDAINGNRAWSKRLREETQALVRARLAKSITREEYMAERKRSTDETAECNRRRDLLDRCETHRRPRVHAHVLH